MLRLSSFAFLAVACIALVVPQPSRAEKRAFVVGIDKYDSLVSLQKAISDADAVAKTLTSIGFQAETSKNVTRDEFEKRWATFLNSLKEGDVATLYFAGHGVQIDGANYLLPKDTPKVDSGEKAILDKAINFHQLMWELEARRPAATLYILDACRDNPFNKQGVDKSGKATLGQTKGLAPIQSVHGAFVMYSAGIDQSAFDFLRDAGKEANSVYVSRLLPLLGTVELNLVDIAKRVQVQVEEDVKSVSRTQRPAYFDGILGSYYLTQLDGVSPLGPTEHIPGANVIRLGAFATWDSNCKSRPAPAIKLTGTPPKYGRIITRFETFTPSGKHFGVSCDKQSERGVGVYYVIDDASKDSTAVENVQFSVKHWSIAPATTANESFMVDLAARYSKRVAPN